MRTRSLDAVPCLPPPTADADEPLPRRAWWEALIAGDDVPVQDAPPAEGDGPAAPSDGEPAP